MLLDDVYLSIEAFSHVGIIVKNIKQSTDLLSLFFKIDSWDIREYSPTIEELLIGKPFKLREAHTVIGGVEIELLQPLAGNTIWYQFLDNNGEGIHHISYIVSAWDENLSKLQENGIEMLAGAIFDGKHWAYFNTKVCGLILELEER